MGISTGSVRRHGSALAILCEDDNRRTSAPYACVPCETAADQQTRIWTKKRRARLT